MGRLVELPFGLATSVGDLPFASADEAVELALATLPSFPTVPTSSSGRQSLLAQACSSISGVDLGANGGLIVSDDLDVGSAQVLVDLGSEEFTALARFLAVIRDHRRSVGDTFIGARLAVLGPITLAKELRSAGMDAEQALSLAQRVVPVVATAILRAYRKVVAHDTAAVVMVEPALVGAMHPTYPLAPREVTEALIPTVDALDQLPGRGTLLIGVHVPGRTDWPAIIRSGVSLISVAVDDSLVSAAPALHSFIEAGGSIAWGAVPVDQPLGTGAELFWRRLGGTWCSLVSEGLDPFQLRACSLVSPSDGLGHFGTSQVHRAMAIVDSLSVRVRRQAIGARLSLGA